MNFDIRKTRKGYLHWEGADKEGKIRIILQDLVITGLSQAFGKCTVIMIPYSRIVYPQVMTDLLFTVGCPNKLS